jgi:hypothetical protein
LARKGLTEATRSTTSPFGLVASIICQATAHHSQAPQTRPPQPPPPGADALALKHADQQKAPHRLYRSRVETFVPKHARTPSQGLASEIQTDGAPRLTPPTIDTPASPMVQPTALKSDGHARNCRIRSDRFLRSDSVVESSSPATACMTTCALRPKAAPSSE